MSPRRQRRGPLASLLLAGFLLHGCALTWEAGGGAARDRLPPGRALVLARVASEENRSIAESAADLLVGGLRDSSDVVGSRDFVSAAQEMGLGVWALRLVERVQRGGRPAPEEGGALMERFGIQTVVTTEVTSYDQVWGKYAKFTRVGVEAQAFHVPAERIIWRVRREAEVEKMRGRAFQYAMEQAVQDLAETIHRPRPTFSVINAWRYWRR